MPRFDQPEIDDLIARTDGACRFGRWLEVVANLRQLAPRLPSRLEILALSVIDLIDEGDYDLVGHVWGHLYDAAGVQPHATR